MDSAAVQKAWAEQNDGVRFPVLADFHPKGRVSQAYGVYNDERGIARRATFVIDGDGVIRDVKLYEPGTLPDPEELLEITSSL